MWDPCQYALFSSHRGRAFHDLTARVHAAEPALVVDLGCGDGALTLTLADRWPHARIVGVDSSTEMLDAAREADTDSRVEWAEGTAETWEPRVLGDPMDVLVTNATLQWVPEHPRLIPQWVQALAPGGWFAMQVPGNFSAPSHRLMRELAARHPRASELEPGLSRADAVVGTSTYTALLAHLGLEVDAWETTYHHILDADGAQRSPVVEWVQATGLRPVLAVLTEEPERQRFLDDYAALIDEAYPRRDFGVLFPFRRIFAVAHRPG